MASLAQLEWISTIFFYFKYCFTTSPFCLPCIALYQKILPSKNAYLSSSFLQNLGSTEVVVGTIPDSPLKKKNNPSPSRNRKELEYLPGGTGLTTSARRCQNRTISTGGSISRKKSYSAKGMDRVQKITTKEDSHKI